jgi:hypothetical protein
MKAEIPEPHIFEQRLGAFAAKGVGDSPWKAKLPIKSLLVETTATHDMHDQHCFGSSFLPWIFERPSCTSTASASTS